MTDYYREEAVAAMVSRIEAHFAATGRPVVVPHLSREWCELREAFPDHEHPIWSKILMIDTSGDRAVLQTRDIVGMQPEMPDWVDLQKMQDDVKESLAPYIGKELSPVVMTKINQSIEVAIRKHLPVDRIEARKAKQLGFVLIDEKIDDSVVGFLSVRVRALGNDQIGTTMSIVVRFEKLHGQ